MSRRQWIYLVSVAFFVGALGSIILGRFVIPKVASLTGWESLNKLVSNAPIVINRTTEVRLNEGVNLIELAKQASGITVSLYKTTNQPPSYAGLGTIMTSDGLIFSSRTTIGSDTKLTAVLNDGKSYEALVRATDPKSDLVVLTIPAQGLSVATFGKSTEMQSGQRVVVPGIANRQFEREFNSGFITNTVSNNKYLGQTFSSERLGDVFGTDLSLKANYGGAPVVNLDGRLVAMVVNDRNELMIAENLQTALASYLENGKIVRPRLGIEYMAISPFHAELQKLNQSGIVVLGIDRTSVAFGKLQANDLIFELNGQSLENTSFEQVLNQSSSTELIRLKFIRAGKEMEAQFNLRPTQ
jgi:S1-C subfamily serine protease